MTDRERLEKLKQYYSSIKGLDPDLQEDIPWLLEQADRLEQLEEEIENWRKVKEATVKLLDENKRYKQALEFYSDEYYYTNREEGTLNLYIINDLGKKARKALGGEK